MARWNDGLFILTDENHYFVLMSERVFGPMDDFLYTEYSGYHHATKESANIELCYVRGDSWASDVRDVIITEVYPNEMPISNNNN